MLELFLKIPVSLPKPIGYVNKLKMFLTDMYGKWFMKGGKKSLQSKVQD